MSSVIRYNVNPLRAKSAPLATGAGYVSAAASGAQALFVFASLMTFMGDKTMPYGIALTHWLTAALMGLSYIIYILGKDVQVPGEYSVRATTAYDKLSPLNQPLARPILDKIYELESSPDGESEEMKNVLLKRLDLIEKMVESERYERVTNAVEDKSDTYSAFEWLKMNPGPPALEAAPSKEKPAPQTDAEFWHSAPFRSEKRRVVFEGDIISG